MATMITQTRLSDTARIERLDGYRAVLHRARTPASQLLMNEPDGTVRRVAYAEAAAMVERGRLGERLVERLYCYTVRS